MDTPTQVISPVPPPGREPEGRARGVVRTIGELLITAGLIVLLFVVYEVYVTDLISAGKQKDATNALEQQWKQPVDPGRQHHFEVADGQGFAKMYVPVFGADYHFTIIEGTGEAQLEIGPGHYKTTAYPGEPGNFAVAGHRVGKGAPFNDLDLLNSCDAIIIETQSSWFVYRVLPKADEIKSWPADEAARRPKCQKVPSLRDPKLPDGGAYNRTVGQEIVDPSDGSVILPFPHRGDAKASAGQQIPLLTLTTCHPRFSDRQRLIVHAVMTREVPKASGQRPPEFEETS